MKSKQYWVLALCLAFVFFSSMGCKPSETKNKKGFSIDAEGMKNATISTMNKDAIRVQGVIEAVQKSSDQGNNYILIVQKIVKYGPTFATVEPKVGEKLYMETPGDVLFVKGDKVVVDVKTPMVTNEGLLNVTMVKK